MWIMMVPFVIWKTKNLRTENLLKMKGSGHQIPVVVVF